MDDVIDGYVAAETKLSNILEKNCINNILYKLIIKTKQDSKYACLNIFKIFRQIELCI